MLLLLSPAKSLDFESKISCKNFTLPHFAKEAEMLVAELKKISVTGLENLMGISKKLAELNCERFQKFSKKFDLKNSRQALLAFDGDVYEPIEKTKFSEKDFAFAQDHVRILSGLYGLLKPLDLIQPYRLEMGTDFKKFPISSKINSKNLYQFWGDKISTQLNKELESLGGSHVVNLASEEYFSVINPKKVSKSIINIVFKEEKEGTLKVIGINSKKARGLMTNFVIKNKITEPGQLKKFNDENYFFEHSLSDHENWVFVRKNKNTSKSK